jgi:IclR family transcriptional regulator, acetate operon repressor
MSAEKQDSVKAAGRTLDLFEIFARQRGPLSLSELAQLMGTPVSSTHALIKTLRARGFLYVLEDRKLVYPTRRMLVLAQQIAANDPMVELLLPVLDEIRVESGETVILGKRQGDAVVYLEVLESQRSIRYSARPGDRKPLHSSAIGKAMLSLLPDPEVVALLGDAGQPRVTEKTLTDERVLLADLAEGRARGLFITRGENVPDVMAIALPFSLGGEPGGIAIAGPMHRVAEKEKACSDLLLSAGTAIAAMESAGAGVRRA